MRKTCEICGGEFEATRRDARYCSDKCRQRKHRGHVRRFEDAIAVEYEAVRQAKSAAADLRRASKLAPAPWCRVYRDLAKIIISELEDVGR